MHDPDNYDKLKGCANQIAAQLIPNLMKKINVSSGEGQKILDFGCGTGKTASKYLLPLAQETDSEIVGLDISREMIDHANKNYSHQHIKFLCGDILSDTFQIQDSSFDHIFSFLVLHWIKDFREVLKKFYGILKPGGKCGLVLVAYHNQFPSYRYLGEHHEWSKYMQGYGQYIPDWIETENPGKECMDSYEGGALNAGFNIVEMSLNSDSYVYDTVDDYAAFMFTLNPFVDVVPKPMHGELTRAIRSHLCGMFGLPDEQEFYAKPVECFYQTLSIVLEKPGK